MGLDMYLYAVDDDGYETDQLVDWGKANAILNWFRNHVCDGRLESDTYYEVRREDLERLVSDCDRVLEDNSLASTLVPTGTGTVRTGGAEYDRWYFSDLRYIRDRIRSELEYCDEFMPDTRFALYASW